MNNYQHLTHIASVPCDGCTACCHNDMIRVLPGVDDLTLYELEEHPLMPNHFMLAHKDNGDCIYLEEEGCGIHSFRPSQCRTFDCRRITMGKSVKQLRQMIDDGKISKAIAKAAKKLMRKHGPPVTP